MAEVRLAAPLALALPDRVQTHFVKACLGPIGDRGASWSSWLGEVGDPVSYLKQEQLGIKAMLPLAYRSLQEAGVEIDGPLRTILRTAHVQEELRTASFGEASAEILRVVTEGGSEFVVVGGADLAYTVYADPVMRHSDRLELMLADADTGSAADVLESLGCERVSSMAESSPRSIDFRHPSGLTARLRPIRQRDASAYVFASATRRSVAGVEVRIPTVSANLIFTTASVYDPQTAESPRWACDAGCLIDPAPDFDWGALADHVAAPFALPLWMTLRYLQVEIGLPIPAEILRELEERASRTSSDGLKDALSSARRSTNGGIRSILASATTLRDRAFVAGWALEELVSPRSRRG